MRENDFTNEFLFGGSLIEMSGNSLRTEMLMDLRTEGWVGLPHGGIGMATIVELGSHLQSGLKSGPISYPFTADYRMGGSRLQIGDAVSLEVSRNGSTLSGQITPLAAEAPYLTAVLSPAPAESQDKGELNSYLPEIGRAHV
jgi:hypothetical protein